MGQGFCRTLADWMRHIYWVGKSKASGVGGETGNTAQEDLKSVDSYNMGEGRTIRVCCSHSCISRPSLIGF